MNEVIENKKKSEVLAEKINELNYGDVLTHEQIASLIEEHYPSNKYTSTDMTKEGRDTYRRVHDRAITLAAAMKGAAIELKTLGEKKHPMALENIKK